MENISFFTPISFQAYKSTGKKDKLTISDRVLQFADSYFFFGGEKAYVTKREFTAEKVHLKRAHDNIQHIYTYKHDEFFFHHEKVSILKKIVLIASYILSFGIVPLVLLATKAVLRSKRQFQELKNVLKSPVYSCRKIQLSNIYEKIINNNFKDIDSKKITIIKENENYNTYTFNSFNVYIKIQHKGKNFLENHYQTLIENQKMNLITGAKECIQAETDNYKDHFILIEDKPDFVHKAPKETPKIEIEVNKETPKIEIEDYSFFKLNLEQKFELVEENGEFYGFGIKFINKKTVTLKTIIDDVVKEINWLIRRTPTHSSYRKDPKCKLDVNKCSLKKYKDVYLTLNRSKSKEDNSTLEGNIPIVTEDKVTLLRVIIQKINEKKIFQDPIELIF